MSKLPNYEEFNQLNESRASTDTMEEFFKAVKQLKRAAIITPLDYQRFDQEMFFEFDHDGKEYRVSYAPRKKQIFITNMADGEEFTANTLRDFTNFLQNDNK